MHPTRSIRRALAGVAVVLAGALTPVTWAGAAVAPSGPDLLARVASLTESKVRARGTFTGASSDGELLLALVRDGSTVVGYLCDGRGVSHWVTGRIEGTTLALGSPDGATISGTFRSTSFTVDVTVPGASGTRRIAGGPSRGTDGLYRVVRRTGTATLTAGWVVHRGAVFGSATLNGKLIPEAHVAVRNGADLVPTTVPVTAVPITTAPPPTRNIPAPTAGPTTAATTTIAPPTTVALTVPTVVSATTVPPTTAAGAVPGSGTPAVISSGGSSCDSLYRTYLFHKVRIDDAFGLSLADGAARLVMAGEALAAWAGAGCAFSAT